MKNSRIKNGIMRIVQGIIIGAGAILPGISGGVLAVVGDDRRAGQEPEGYGNKLTRATGHAPPSPA